MGNIIQKDISTFAQSGFPAFYLEEGPVFVAFAENYYRWLEGKTPAATTNVSASTVQVVASNNTIVGNSSFFTRDFSSGDQIAVWKTNEYYDIFTVNAVSNNTLLTIVESPIFTNTSSIYSFVEVKRNYVYDQRRMIEYTDVDQTIDDYIIYFKNKYLADIQFTTVVDIRLLLKHTLDLYRAKGTPQALELLFRIVFGEEIDVYYPGDDVFRTSDGQWITPKYIEIVLSDNSILLNNRQIIGSISGATAFVDRVVRRNNAGILTDVLYISSINGHFLNGDLLDFTGIDHLDPDDRLVVRGSLTGIVIDLNGTGENYNVGDILDVVSATGRDAKARVTTVVNRSGVINFDFLDGGYGYEPDGNSAVIISEKIIRLTNVSVDAVLNPWVNTYTNIFEMVTQPSSNVNYISANGHFSVGTNVYSYYVNNAIQTVSQILSINETNSTSGFLALVPLTGNLSSGQFFSTANAVSANVNPIAGYTDTTATGNVMGQVDNLLITIASPASISVPGDFIYQIDEVGGIRSWGTVNKAITVGANVQLSIFANTTSSVFRIGSTMYDASNTAIGNTADISFSIGVINTTSAFVSLPGNFVYFNDSNTHAAVSSVSQGSQANVSVSNNLIYQETINVGNVYLFTYKSTFLGANTYGFPASPTSNHLSVIFPTRSFTTINIGRLTAITNINEGASYTAAPIIRVLDKRIVPYQRENYFLDTDSGPFQIGELVTQSVTSARGLVISSNTSSVHLQRLRFYSENDFIVSNTTSTTFISGANSGITSNVISISFDTDVPIGFDASLTTTLTTANSSIATAQVIDSGFNFVTGQDVIMTNNVGSAFGVANCFSYGVGSGFYQQKGGFLSDQKKLHDGFYWQDFSYDVLSSIPLDKYKDMLRQITHVAGTKNFASFVTKKVMDSVVSMQPSSIIIGTSSDTDGAIFNEISGSSIGISSVIGFGTSYMITYGTSSGVATVNGSADIVKATFGTSSGIGSATGNGVSLSITYGTSAGTSTVTGIASMRVSVSGQANGTSTAFGFGTLH